MRRLTIAIPALGVGALLLAGCGTGSSANPSNSPTQAVATANSGSGSSSAITFSGSFDGSGPAGGACRLFSQAEASTAISESVKAPDEGTDLGCSYVSQSESTPGQLSTGFGSCSDITQAARDAGARPISGRAGVAMLTPSGTLYTCKGRHGLNVSLSNATLSFCQRALSGKPCPAVVATEENIATTMFGRTDVSSGACTKYTRDDATQAIGDQAATPADLSLTHECKYSGTGNDTGAFVDVQLDTCSNISQEARSQGAKPKAGIGDRAFLESAVGGTLYACKGNRGVGVQLNNPNAQNPLATETSIFSTCLPDSKSSSRTTGRPD